MVVIPLVGVMVLVDGMVVVVIVLVDGMVVVVMVLDEGMVLVEDMVVVEGMVVEVMVVVLVMVEEGPFARARLATLQVKAATVRMRMLFFMYFSFCCDWAHVPLSTNDIEQPPCH